MEVECLGASQILVGYVASFHSLIPVTTRTSDPAKQRDFPYRHLCNGGESGKAAEWSRQMQHDQQSGEPSQFLCLDPFSPAMALRLKQKRLSPIVLAAKTQECQLHSGPAALLCFAHSLPT